MVEYDGLARKGVEARQRSCIERCAFERWPGQRSVPMCWVVAKLAVLTGANRASVIAMSSGSMLEQQHQQLQ